MHVGGAAGGRNIDGGDIDSRGLCRQPAGPGPGPECEGPLGRHRRRAPAISEARSEGNRGRHHELRGHRRGPALSQRRQQNAVIAAYEGRAPDILHPYMRQSVPVEVERIGGDKPVTIDVRVVVATHRDLEARVREDKFRQDLFHRIYVFPLILPPLRERREDIPALVEHFAAQVSAQNGWKAVPFSPEAMAALQSHAWPGNVRELRNMVERLMLLATDGQVDLATVQISLPKGGSATVAGSSAFSSGPLADRVDDFEREVILAELKRSNSNVSLAAKSLGLERSHLYKKAEQLGIDLRALRREHDSTHE